MAYSTNPGLIAERADLLDRLAAGQACAWECDPDPQATQRLAYRIRECLAIATRYSEDFPALAEAAKRFSIVIVRDGLVEAKAKQANHASAVVVGAAAPMVQTPLAVARPNAQTVGLTRADELIAAWISVQPSNDPLRFEQTTLSDIELRALHAWTSDPMHHLAILVGDGHVTLTRFKKGIEAIAWTPPQPAPAPKRFDL
jgi:hypothetical protein